MLEQLESSPKQAFLLVKWAEKRPGYELPAPIFNSMLGILARAGELKWVLMELMEKIKRGDWSNLVSAESFGILIRHYSRSGKILPAIYTFEFANSLGMDLFEVLLNALCKYGHVNVASDYIDRKTHLDSDWVPSVDVYNILFDGWFRLQNLNMVERLWLQITEENLLPDVNTYGIVVKGYCRMGFVDKAVKLLGEMRRGGLRPDREVYDPIVDSLARAGRLKEALGVMERYLVLERGPTSSAYNSLVKGFCEAGDLAGAGKILKMMTSRGIVPTSLTYNYFFRYFKKHGKVEDGVNLYRKMMKSGYSPDQRTSHLILTMLCEKEELELALEISKEMRCRKQVLDLAISTMLIDLLCKNHRLKEAVTEFENLMQSGFVPKYATYQTLHNQLKRKGLRELALKLSGVVATVPRSMTLPITVEGLGDISRQRKKAVMRRSRVMSNVLKTCSDPRELAKPQGSCTSTSYGKKPVEKGRQVDDG